MLVRQLWRFLLAKEGRFDKSNYKILNAASYIIHRRLDSYRV